MIQHFRVKLFAEDPVTIDLGDAIPVFHRWIRDRVLDELLIDVADYRHVPAGPGVVLVGHDALYSLDNGGRRLGLLYNRRTVLEGRTGDKLHAAFEAARRACRRLEAEPEFRGKLRFSDGECEVSVNDRALAPNTEQTWLALKGELEQFLSEIWLGRTYAVERAKDPRELFRITAKVA